MKNNIKLLMLYRESGIQLLKTPPKQTISEKNNNKTTKNTPANNTKEIIQKNTSILPSISTLSDTININNNYKIVTITEKNYDYNANLLLHKILNSININNLNSHIIYIQKTHNISIYTKLLQNIISHTIPHTIILMGSLATYTFLQNKCNITILRKEECHYYQTTENKKIKTFVTFNPLYLLSQPDKKKLVWEDMLKIQEHIKKQKNSLAN